MWYTGRPCLLYLKPPEKLNEVHLRDPTSPFKNNRYFIKGLIDARLDRDTINRILTPSWISARDFRDSSWWAFMIRRRILSRILGWKWESLALLSRRTAEPAYPNIKPSTWVPMYWNKKKSAYVVPNFGPNTVINSVEHYLTRKKKKFFFVTG